MRPDKVSSYKLKVSSWAAMAAITTAMLLTGCSPKQEGGDTMPTEGASAPAAVPNDSDLLMRVCFAGTTALSANTNAAYLTNITALPETAALGKRIVERFASLPERLVKRGARSAEPGTSAPSPSPGGAASTANSQPSTNALEPIFADLLRDGFVLELRGDSNGVTTMILGAKAPAESTAKWNQALAATAKEWFGEDVASKTGNWAAGQARMQVRTDQNSILFGLSSRENLQLSTFNFQPVEAEATNTLEVEMSSVLLPGPIQRSVYGGFERFEFSVEPDNQSLRIRGKAIYAHDLPQLGLPPAVPTNLVTEPTISFTIVRELGAWLEPQSPIRSFLPKPAPGTGFFWGCQTSPYQIFIALPYGGREEFKTRFGPDVLKPLTSLSTAIYAGDVELDTENADIRWHGHAFITPRLRVMESGTNSYLLAETFPQTDYSEGLTPALMERATAHTNTVLYDWEFTTPRFDTWVRIGQLALLYAYREQLSDSAPALKWTLVSLAELGRNCNTSTEITQTGARELTFARRGPLAFSSIEFFWLVNWFESPNFPDANFLTPAKKTGWGTPEKQ